MPFLLQFHVNKNKIIIIIDTLLLWLVLCKTLIETYIIIYYKYIIRHKIGKIDYEIRQIEGYKLINNIYK